jgi:hypothetical protein
MIAMMKSIEVECYSGGLADERPRRVVIDGREHFIIRLLNSSIEESIASKEQVHRFTVLTDEGVVIELIRAGDEWHLESER